MSLKNNTNIDSLFNKTTYTILKLIFDFPTTIFHIRKLSRLTNLSTTAVTKVIRELQKENIITITRTDLSTNVVANIESVNYRHYKQLLNIHRLKSIIKEPLVKTLILFGSYSKGEDLETSDIDLFVVGKFLNLKKYEKELNRSINVVTSMDSIEFKNTLANGIVLKGYLKLN